MPRRDSDGFTHRFEGPEVLDGLLSLAGSPYTTEDVAARMGDALQEKLTSDAVIPALFEGEPRFPDPTLARQLFQNLLGLWDLLAAGKPLPKPRALHADRAKKEKPAAPAPFGPEGPTDTWVKAAASYLARDGRARERLAHSFENRQDALLTYLDEQPLSDQGYGVLRTLLGELHAMLELGWAEGPRAVDPAQLSRQEQDVPELGPLKAYADEAVLRAERDSEAPLPQEEAQRVRELAARSLRALGQGRRKGR